MLPTLSRLSVSTRPDGRLRHRCSSEYLRISPLHSEFHHPLRDSSYAVSSALPRLSPGLSHPTSSVHVPQIVVDGLDDFLHSIETLYPSLENARSEITTTQTVSFYPGLGELFTPGSKLTCYPEGMYVCYILFCFLGYRRPLDVLRFCFPRLIGSLSSCTFAIITIFNKGMDGTPLGCQVVQCWYDEEINKATNKLKRRFILVIEFIVSVGDELVFVAASDVYPEFHDPNRNTPIKDLTHRKLVPEFNVDDAILLQKLQLRGEFYASVATKNHYLEYHPNSFFPIIGGGWNSNAIRPLSKGGRVMVDVKRGILEGHVPVRSGTTGVDGMSDTVKEAIKLFEQSKRTGVAVPFRTCILPPGFLDTSNEDVVGEAIREAITAGDISPRATSCSLPRSSGTATCAKRMWNRR